MTVLLKNLKFADIWDVYYLAHEAIHEAAYLMESFPRRWAEKFPIRRHLSWEAVSTRENGIVSTYAAFDGNIDAYPKHKLPEGQPDAAVAFNGLTLSAFTKDLVPGGHWESYAASMYRCLQNISPSVTAAVKEIILFPGLGEGIGGVCTNIRADPYHKKAWEDIAESGSYFFAASVSPNPGFFGEMLSTLHDYRSSGGKLIRGRLEMLVEEGILGVPIQDRLMSRPMARAYSPGVRAFSIPVLGGFGRAVIQAATYLETNRI